MNYWAGSGVTPSPETDSRDYSERVRNAAARVPRPGPAPLTPTTRAEDIDALLALDAPAARAGLLRCLEYYGAMRLSEGSLRIPFGIGADAPSEDVDTAAVPLAKLEAAARACVEQAAAATAAAAAANDV